MSAEITFDLEHALEKESLSEDGTESTRVAPKVVRNPFFDFDVHMSKILQCLCQQVERLVPFAFVLFAGDGDLKIYFSHCGTAVADDMVASQEQVGRVREGNYKSVRRI